MAIRQLADRLRASLWFVPIVGLVLAVVAAAVMLGLSSWLVVAQVHLPLIFGGGPDGARGMLEAIAGSVVTVAGVVFSVTVVALQLTSTQFSPRVLRNFMRDRPTQVTLAIFMATIAYALLILRTIHSADPSGQGAFVPGLAVTGALLLALTSLVMLIYFIHHISVGIQVGSIIASVTSETLATIDDLVEEFKPHLAVPPAEAQRPGGRAVAARRSGYLQYLDLGGLLRVAEAHDLEVAVLVPPGGWVQEGAPLFRVQVSDEATHEELGDWLLDRVAIGGERSMRQDIGFGVQQLVDVAVKALSPGINDPTTATQCIDRLTQVLVAVGRRPELPNVLADEHGAPRLTLRFPSFGALLRQAFEQIRHYGATTPVVVRHLAVSLAMIHAAVPTESHEPIRIEAQRLVDGADELEPPDRTEAKNLLASVLGENGAEGA